MKDHWISSSAHRVNTYILSNYLKGQSLLVLVRSFHKMASLCKQHPKVINSNISVLISCHPNCVVLDGKLKWGLELRSSFLC